MDDQARSPWERLRQAQAIAQATRQRAIEAWRSAGLAGLLALQQDLWTEGDRAIAQALADQPVACDRGCAWCCYLTVPVMGLEARAIAHWLAVLPDPQQQIFRQRLTTTAARLQAVDPSDRLAQKIPCAFLEVDGACGIYPVRPATCRSHHARCAEDCQAGWESGTWPARSVPTANFELEASMAGLQAACEDCQVSIAVGELHGAVLATISPWEDQPPKT